MKGQRSARSIAVLLSFAAVAACDDSPIDASDDAVEQVVATPVYLSVAAGETRSIDLTAYNAAGSVVATEVDFEACDSKITVETDTLRPAIENGTGVLVTGQTLGRSCITASAGGEEVTILVRVVPGSLELTGPELIASGQTGATNVAFLDVDGSPVTGFGLGQTVFSSDDEDVASVDASGTVTGKAPGTTDIIVELVDSVGAVRADTIEVTVVPGTLSGTITPSSGAAGTELTIELGATDPAIDETSDAVAIIDGVNYPMWLEVESDSNTAVTSVPFDIEAGTTVTVVLTGLGGDEVALGGDFTVNADATNDQYGGRDPFLGEASTVILTLPYDDAAAIDGANGETNDGYLYTATADQTVDVFLDWDDENGSGDLDVLVYDIGAGGYHACTGGVATGGHPEHGECDLTAGSSYFIIINDYAEANAVTNYYLQLHEVVEDEE